MTSKSRCLDQRSLEQKARLQNVQRLSELFLRQQTKTKPN